MTVTTKQRTKAITKIAVSMAQIVATKNKDTVLYSPGLGSCIGVAMYDPVAKCSCLGHVVLPDSNLGRRNGKPGKFMNTAIPEMLKEIAKYGARKKNIVIKAAGGAKMFSAGKEMSNVFSIGERNYEALKMALKSEGLLLTNYDVGGTEGRTLSLACINGEVSVRTVSKILRVL